MCDICGEENVTCEVIGVYPPGMIAMKENHIVCPICEGCGQYKLPSFKNPRPCPVCQGVGQMNPKLVPSSETIADMLLKVIAPR